MNAVRMQYSFLLLLVIVACLLNVLLIRKLLFTKLDEKYSQRLAVNSIL